MYLEKVKLYPCGTFNCKLQILVKDQTLTLVFISQCNLKVNFQLRPWWQGQNVTSKSKDLSGKVKLLPDCYQRGA